MTASKKPSTRKKAIENILDKNSVKNIFIALFVVITIILFLLSWKSNAFVVRDNTAIDVEYSGNTKISKINSTLTVENYYPFEESIVRPRLLLFNDTGQFPIYNVTEFLKQEQISINSFSVKYMYGDEEVLTPYSEKNLTAFFGVAVPKLTKTTIKYDWSYNSTKGGDGESSSLKYIRLILTTSPDDDIRLTPFEYWVPLFTFDLFRCLSPYLVVTFAGFLFSYFVLDTRKLSKDYSNLSKFSEEQYSAADEEGKKETETSLKQLINFPGKLVTYKKLLFGLSVVLFKNFINNICKQHHEAIDGYEKIAPYKRKSLKGILSKYSKKTYKEPLEFLPEVKSVLIATGFLTTIGVSLAFNVGAGIPLVFTVLVFYYFINLGATIGLVEHSKTDFRWMLLITAISLIVIVLPKLVEMFRILG